MLKATFKKHNLIFKRASGTSRGILRQKETWFIILEQMGRVGIGECGMFRGLSMDDRPSFESKLKWTCENIGLGEAILLEELKNFPAIQTGLETAFRSLAAKDPFQVFPSDFSQGNASIPINGLVWMGDEKFMREQITEKIASGFNCIKMKIGAIEFDKELQLIREVRKRFSASEIEIRVDANGAFSPSEALEKLKRLSDLQLHSIEQPIKQGQWQEMASLCEKSPLAVALDEELIGLVHSEDRQKLMETIRPQYIILKPTLVGGFSGSDNWISISSKYNCGWWITSALESNVGLNAISQFTFTKNSKLPQGLGTGGLFTNNIPSPLRVKEGALYYSRDASWNMDEIMNIKE